MEQANKAPARHSELHDPKLPQIHGSYPVDLSISRLRPAPIPLPPKEV